MSTDGHPCSRAFTSPFCERCWTEQHLWEHLSCRDGNREPGFLWIQSEQGLCCHLLAQWTPTASPGASRSPNSGHHGFVSKGMGMTFWQGDKRDFFLSLTCWPGTWLSLRTLGSELVVGKHEGKSTFPTSDCGKPPPLPDKLGVAVLSLPLQHNHPKGWGAAPSCKPQPRWP